MELAKTRAHRSIAVAAKRGSSKATKRKNAKPPSSQSVDPSDELLKTLAELAEYIESQRGAVIF
jgi:hypothetical protein